MNKMYKNCDMSRFAKQIVSVILIFTISNSLSALADTQPKDSGAYIGISAGKALATQNFKDVESYEEVKAKPRSPLMYSAAIGYKFNSVFRMDVNAQLRNFKYSGYNDIDLNTLTQKFDSRSVFLNIYCHIPNYTVFSPYITVGAGYTQNRVGDLIATGPIGTNFNAPGKSTSNFSWNAGAGVVMKLYENIDLDLAYRYINLGKIRIDSTEDETGVQFDAVSQDINVHQISAGLTYQF